MTVKSFITFAPDGVIFGGPIVEEEVVFVVAFGVGFHSLAGRKNHPNYWL
jgi:hypothetical protein